MKKVTIILSSLFVVLLGVCVYLFISNKQKDTEMQELIEQSEFEREQTVDEYEEMLIQIDGYGKNIQNDSLAELLSQEQQHVQDLLEELRITKATNAKRIAELKKELSTVRAVMVEYVRQIDSLSATNARLEIENKQVRRQFTEVQERATQLEQQNTQLAQTVTRASMLEIVAFKVTTLNARDRKTTAFNKIQKLQFDYTISKNITTEVGLKKVYIRIVRPDGEVMVKDEANTFEYENQQIRYSLVKECEYAGEELSDVQFWPVEEILQKGTYNADFFIDGNLIGSFPFELK